MNTVGEGKAFVRWNETTLILGNPDFERTIDLSKGYPVTVRLTAGKTTWAEGATERCDLSFININMPGDHETKYHLLAPVRAEKVLTPSFDAPHLLITLQFGDEIQQAAFTRRIRVYLDMPCISVENEIKTKVFPNCYWSHRSPLSGAGNAQRFALHQLESAAEILTLADGVKAVEAVEFFGRTDYHNEMVKRHRLPAGDFTANGNLLFLSAPDGGKLVIVQEAPPSSERRDFEKHDFRLEGNTLNSCGWGIAPEDVVLDTPLPGYRHTLIFGSANDDYGVMTKQYLARRFPMKMTEGAVLVNPWGCGKFPEYTGEKFLLEEIQAAGAIGAEVYQIDDSWQQGAGLNELTGNNRAVTPDFWAISKTRLPHGFAPLKEAAEKAGIHLGLWCAPSYNTAFADWEAFADRLLEYRKQGGFVTIKVDGVRLQSHLAEMRLKSLLHKVRTATEGRVFFNLDTTNGQRPGYFLFLEYGNIFLENRYLQHHGVIEYNPEKTLRNLWDLAGFVRTQTLQVEVPAPDDVPDGFSFERDPRNYPFEYWCAVAFFANMLIWTAPSKLSAETQGTLKKMTALHKKVRPLFWESIISPWGTRPDGRSLTGFSSDAGFLLLFCELDSPQETAQLPPGTWSILAGGGSLDGRNLHLPHGHYALLQRL